MLPGTYTLRLTANGATVTQPLVVHMDPRVVVSPADLRAQFDAASRVSAAIERDFTAIAEARALRESLREARRGGKPNDAVKGGARGATVAAAVDSLDAEIAAAAGEGPHASKQNLARLNGELASLLQTLDGADARPTTQAMAAVTQLERSVQEQVDAWERLEHTALPRVNATLRNAGAPVASIPTDLSRWRIELQRGESADKDRDEP